MNMSGPDSKPGGPPDPAEREAFVRRAVETANANALRLALYQATGDPDLAAMKPYQKEIRGGALLQNAVRDEDLDQLKEKAVRYLLSVGDVPSVPQQPDEAEARRLMELFSTQEISDNYARFGIEELAYDEFPRDAQWNAKPPPRTLDALRVLVVGAGISGIAASIQLKRLGIPFTVVERQEDIGGTWHLNNYPQARVDTSSYLYQFKFEKNYPWKEYYAARDETKEYLDHVANKHGVLGDFRFRIEVVTATWDEERAVWLATLRHKDGREEELVANFIISGSGLFATPNSKPDIPGIETYQGKIWHTAHWDYSYSYAGKRIALIGTGSTGTQLMPAMAAAAEHLAVYQRTPSWIFGVDGYRSKVPSETQWLFDHLPYYWNWISYSSFDTAMQLQNAQSYDHRWRETHHGVSAINQKLLTSLTEYIHEKFVTRPDLIKKITPKYAPLARRLVVDNGFYEALLQSNLELVTEPIERITPTGILTADKTERTFDLIILSTGFKVSQYLFPTDYRGRDGATLTQAWEKDGARSYLGATMPGFPNLFMFYGPNGQPRSGGFYSWAEIWARYAANVIIHTIENGHTSVEVKSEVFDRYNERLDEEMKEILWEVEGAGSYYNNEFGRSSVNLPFLTEDYHAMMATPDSDDFKFR